MNSSSLISNRNDGLLYYPDCVIETDNNNINSEKKEVQPKTHFGKLVDSFKYRSAQV